jgi:C-terminal processing protease CtpA/Prc
MPEGHVLLKRLLRLIAAASLIASLAACGGGGGGAVASPPPPPPATDWQQGVFAPEENFVNRCENPRSGTDPTNNNQPYPDMQGSFLDEKNFLRSFSNRTYLWYNEIVDRDPATFTTPTDYFDVLRTFENIPGTNEPKDPDGFHYAVDTLEWFNQTQGGVSFGYGAELTIISGSPPRRAIVAFTEPNSPAANAGIMRGAELLEIDGVDFVNDNTQAGLDTILDGLFPSEVNEQHTFTFLAAGAATPTTVTLSSAVITNAMVQATQVFDTPTGKVGYLVFNYHRAPAEEELIDAINQLIADAAPDPIDDLIVDLRYNGGGFGIIASQLAYMVAGPQQTDGRTFDRLQYNDKHTTVDIFGNPILPDPFVDVTTGFFTLPFGEPLPALALSRVFVITGSGTASASELFINGLRGIDVQVIQIGATTTGKPYGFFEEPNCGTSYFTVQFSSVNAKGWGDYSLGFMPSAVDDGEAQVLGCTVADDFTRQLGDPDEDRLEVALAYQAGQACITPQSLAPGTISKTTIDVSANEGYMHKTPFDSNLIMLRPRQ